MDRDILNTFEDERVASKLWDHAWAFKTPESWEKYRTRAKDVDYNFDPELSEDMRTSLNNTVNAADMVGGPNFKWDLVQLQDDPICSSAGCTQYKQPEGPKPPPRDYFVPNFGMDHDIKSTFTDLKVAEAMWNHAWAFKTPESWEKYRVRAKDVDYNFDPELSEDMRVSLHNAKVAEETVGGPGFEFFAGEPVAEVVDDNKK
jgi:hypothetical protein